jgi:hypothetical protein
LLYQFNRRYRGKVFLFFILRNNNKNYERVQQKLLKNLEA